MRGGAERVMLGGVILSEKPARRKRRRGEWRFSPELLRLREIEKLITHRHGGQLPDPGDTDDRETCFDYVRAAALALAAQDMAAWCRRWAPWVSAADVVPIEAVARSRRRMMRADGVAGLLHVTMAERTALKLRTIGAADMPKAARKKLAKQQKRERDRKRDEKKRRAAGAVDRASYVATSVSTLKPWEAAGMSRRTWYRKGRPTVGTSPSRIDIIGYGEQPVPRAQGQPSPSPIRGHVTGRVATGDGSPETQFLARAPRGAEPHGNCEEASPEVPHRRNAA
jgi:hypothetical protein